MLYCPAGLFAYHKLMSLNIRENHSLKHLNTFGFDQRAEYFVSAGTEAEIEQAVQFAKDEGSINYSCWAKVAMWY